MVEVVDMTGKKNGAVSGAGIDYNCSLIVLIPWYINKSGRY